MMEFNTLVKNELLPILEKYGFEIIEELRNTLCFQSANLKLNLILNVFEKSHLIELGKQDEILFPLNNYVVKEIWGSSALPIEQLTTSEFVRNITSLFKTNEGVEILKGNLNTLKDIVNRQSEEYTRGIFQKQSLEVASKAWVAKDYVAFVKSIEEIGINNLPKSYLLKYKKAILNL